MIKFGAKGEKAKRRKGGIRRLSWLLLVICWLGALPAVAADQSGEMVTLGGLKVVVWPAEAPAPGKQPVIIFSHGFHGYATQSSFLMEALAAHGYLVFAPNHRDATGRQGEARWLDRPEKPFRKSETWSDQNYRDRAVDVGKLLAAIKTDPRFRDRADLNRLGLVGHSLGGYTMLGLAGAWPSWRLEGIRAVLALSPYTQPFLAHQTLGGLKAPVMYQGGTWDFGVTPALRKVEGAYDQTPAPKYYVEFTRAGHLAWADLRAAAHREIAVYSLAFLDHYVKGLPAEPVLTKSLPGVAALRYDSELGRGGTPAGQESGSKGRPAAAKIRQAQPAP